MNRSPLADNRPEPTTEELLAKVLADPAKRTALRAILKQADEELEPPIHIPTFLKASVARHGVKRVAEIVGLSVPTISRICAEIETLPTTMIVAGLRLPALRELDAELAGVGATAPVAGK